jgi:hypothetical protein
LELLPIDPNLKTRTGAIGNNAISHNKRNIGGK